MSLTAGTTQGLVDKTEIDVLFYAEVDRENEPDEVIATNPVFFKQSTTNKAAEITADLGGPGNFEEHSAGEEIKQATITVQNQKTHSVLNFKRSVKIDREFFDDDQHATVEQTVSNLGMRARTSRDKYSFERSYGDAFSGVTTAAGVALISDSHTAQDGTSVDNLETGAITPDNLKTVIKSLRLQRHSSDGELAGHNPRGLLVSPDNYDEAVEILDSDLIANSAENNINFFKTKYGTMTVGTSAFLSSTYNSLNSNVDTSYFVVAQNHSITRWVRQALDTMLVPFDTDDRDRYTYKASYRDIVSVVTYDGVVGSNGTA